MKIVVIGGHGRVGSKIVGTARRARARRRRRRPQTGVNTITGEGLAEVLAGADVVVDVSNSPSFEDDAVMEFFRTSTRNILAAEQAAGVGHHVAMSVVGSDRLPDSGYLRAKVAQEKLIEGSDPVLDRPLDAVLRVRRADRRRRHRGRHRPRAGGAHPARSRPTTPPAPWAGSPSARRSTASSRSAAPRPYRFDELIQHGLSARNDPRHVVADPDARYFGTKLTDGSLLPGENAQLGETRFEDWLGALATAG